MSLQVACLIRCMITLVAFVRLFSTALWVFKFVLKLPASKDAQLHWLHFFSSPVCVRGIVFLVMKQIYMCYDFVKIKQRSCIKINFDYKSHEIIEINHFLIFTFNQTNPSSTSLHIFFKETKSYILHLMKPLKFNCLSSQDYTGCYVLMPLVQNSLWMFVCFHLFGFSPLWVLI